MCLLPFGNGVPCKARRAPLPKMPMIRSHLTRWLAAPLVTGWSALACVAAAVALPTAFRAAIDGVVTGCEFTPYLPFVLLGAVVIGWWQAGAIAFISVGILGGLFASSTRMFDMPCFISAAGDLHGRLGGDHRVRDARSPRSRGRQRARLGRPIGRCRAQSSSKATSGPAGTARAARSASDRSAR